MSDPSETLCAHCATSNEPHATTCTSCGADPRLDGRYRLLRRLGHGAVGTTFAGVRESDGQPVAIKEMLVRRLEDFKAHDLFTREAGVLRMLDHPAIPRYYDDFVAGQGRHTGLYLVTELIAGHTLEHELTTKRHSQKEVLQIVRELCDVLIYLHGLAPPVVHRDIKLSNVMRRDQDGPRRPGGLPSDGRLVLIDFGAVKESLRGTDGSTVAGTFGYMPPEQLAGRATPASDIYALGVLCVALLTRMSPHDLLDEQNRLQWREHVTSPPLRALLDEMLEPDPSRRLGDAETVAQRLDDIIAGRAKAPAAPPVRSGGGGFGGLGGGLFDKLPTAIQRVLEGVVSSATPGVAEPPPPTPRPIPSGFAGRADPVASFFRFFGLVFGGIPLLMSGFVLSAVGFQGGFILLFPLIGGSMATFGFMRIAKAKRLYRDGEAAPAVVTESFLNTSVKLNGSSPFKITFRYETPDGTTRTCTVSRFRTPPDLRVPGAQVYALYNPAKPDEATLWPV